MAARYPSAATTSSIVGRNSSAAVAAAAHLRSNNNNNNNNNQLRRSSGGDDSGSDVEDSPPHSPPESPVRRHSLTTLTGTTSITTLTSPGVGVAASKVSTAGFLGTRPLLAFDEKTNAADASTSVVRPTTRPRPPVESKVKKLWDRPSLSTGATAAPVTSGWLPPAKGALPRDDDDDMDDMDGGFLDDGPDAGDDMATAGSSSNVPVVAAIARPAPVVRARENKSSSNKRVTRAAATRGTSTIAPLSTKPTTASNIGAAKTSSRVKTGSRGVVAGGGGRTRGLESSGVIPSSTGAAAPLKIVALLNLSDNSVYSSSVVPIAEPLFSATPTQVSFSNYVPFQPYSIQIALRNKDNVSRELFVKFVSNSMFNDCGSLE
jgi:hypothetical protein